MVRFANIGPSGELYYPTIEPAANFDAARDATELDKALDGRKKDEVINIITKRSYEQRIKIKEEYTACTGRELEDVFKSKFSGNFERVCVSLFRSPGLLMAKRLKKAMKGAGTDEKVLCEVLGSATNEEIKEIKEAYKQEYGKELLDVVKDDVGGDFERCLVALLQARRDEPTDEEMVKFKNFGIRVLINYDEARAMADKLYNAGEGRLGTDEDIFLSILCKQSVWQIAAIDMAYKEKTSNSIIDAIKSELDGSMKYLLVILARSCLDRPTLFAEMIAESLEGFGTDDDALISLIVSRSSKDLGTIKQVYSDVNDGKSLVSAVKGDTVGDYEDIMVAVMGE